MLNEKQKLIHDRALKFSRNYKKTEVNLFSIFREVYSEKVHRALACESVFTYALNVLELSPHMSYSLSALERKSFEIPALGESICSERLSISKAARLLASIKPENAEALIAFAETATHRELDRHIAGKNPQAKYRNQMKFVEEDVLKVTVFFRGQGHVKLGRSMDLYGNGTKDLDRHFIMLAEADLEKNHPEYKAKRAEERAAKKGVPLVPDPEPFCARKNYNDAPLTAAERHATFALTGGKCTFISPDGKRCDSERHIDVHHIVHQSQGGSNHPSNLTTLCGVHHDFVHQIAFKCLETTWTFFR